MSKKDQAEKPIIVNQKEMLSGLMTRLGPNGTLALWMVLDELKTEDTQDAVLLRQLREVFLRADGVMAGTIIGVLRTWDSSPEAPALNRCLEDLREHTTFRLADKLAEHLKGIDEVKRAEVKKAVGTLRSLFAGTLLDAKVSDVIN